MTIKAGGVALAAYPAITYNTNACGEKHTGRVPKWAMDAIPFEDGPGVVLTYLVSIGGSFYALGNLEVAYADPVWERDGLACEQAVKDACEAAVKVMRSKAAPDVIVFPLDHEEMPARCVISVAVPVSMGSSRDSMRSRLAKVFDGYEHADERLIAAPA